MSFAIGMGMEGVEKVVPPSEECLNCAIGFTEEKFAPEQVKVTVSFNFGATTSLVKSTQDKDGEGDGLGETEGDGLGEGFGVPDGDGLGEADSQ